MDTFQAILIAVFGVIITIVLLTSMTEMIEAGVTVKMNARLEHLADDVANAVQHLSSSTIDSAAETFDVDIKDVTIKIESNRYVTVMLNGVEFTDQFHIAEGITVADSEVHDPGRLCFIKKYDPVSLSPTITMTGYDNSPCDTDYREVDLRYDWDWGFEGEQQIDGVVDGPNVILDTGMPLGKIKDAAFHDFDIATPNKNYFKVRPAENTRYHAVFDIYVPEDTQGGTVNNYAEFTLDISPMDTLNTDVIFYDWQMPECTLLWPSDCIEILDDTKLIFRLSTLSWGRITLVNTRLTTELYSWGFYETNTLFEDTVTDYPYNTVSMVTFHNFITPEKTYIDITPGDLGPNYFSFNLLVPDDDNVNTHNNISLTLSILPFYSINVDVRDGAKAVPECTSMDKPCFRRLGSEIMFELEPGTYDLTVEDPAY